MWVCAYAGGTQRSVRPDAGTVHTFEEQGERKKMVARKKAKEKEQREGAKKESARAKRGRKRKNGFFKKNAVDAGTRGGRSPAAAHRRARRYGRR